MSELVRARVGERLAKLRLGAVAARLDAILAAVARSEPTYLDFLDQILAEETEAKQRKRVAMGIQVGLHPFIPAPAFHQIPRRLQAITIVKCALDQS